jgi:CheY-like chemotaxis protein
MFKYIYLCVNNIKDYFYGGKHETDNFYDGYTGSSNSAEFKDDYNRGQIKPPQILFFHGDSNVILACEHFMLLSLKNAGFNTILAMSGDEARTKISQQKPSAIVLDVVLPNESGFELCRDLKDKPETKDIPIILCSTKSGEMDKFWGMKQGASAYLTKPVDVTELIRTIKLLVKD